MYYIKCLKNIDEEQWAHIFNYLQVNRTKVIKYNGNNGNNGNSPDDFTQLDCRDNRAKILWLQGQ